MDEQENSVAPVRRAATRGARSVTRREQIVEDAVSRTVERWEEALLKGKDLGDVPGWAFRVAANAAKKLAPGSAKRWGDWDAAADKVGGVDGDVDSGNRIFSADFRKTLLANLGRRRKLLRGRQYEVLRKMAEVGMTQSRAARELGMDRANLRRAFRSGLARLRVSAK